MKVRLSANWPCHPQCLIGWWFLLISAHVHMAGQLAGRALERWGNLLGECRHPQPDATMPEPVYPWAYPVGSPVKRLWRGLARLCVPDQALR